MTTPVPPPEPSEPRVRPAPPPPTSRPVRNNAGDGLNLIPLVIGALSAIAVFVSSFLAWFSFEGRDGGLTGTSVPVEFLWNTSIGGDTPSLLVVLAPLAGIIVLGAIFGQARLLAVVGGFAVIIISALFVFQTSELLGELNIDEGTFDALGIGPFVAFFGGAVAIVAGLIPRTD